MDAALAEVLSELDGISILKEGQSQALKNLLCEKDVFALFLTGFDKSFVKHNSLLPQGSDAHLVLSLAPIEILNLLLRGSTCSKKIKINLTGQLYIR